MPPRRQVSGVVYHRVGRDHHDGPYRPVNLTASASWGNNIIEPPVFALPGPSSRQSFRVSQRPPRVRAHPVRRYRSPTRTPKCQMSGGSLKTNYPQTVPPVPQPPGANGRQPNRGTSLDVRSKSKARDRGPIYAVNSPCFRSSSDRLLPLEYRADCRYVSIRVLEPERPTPPVHRPAKLHFYDTQPGASP